MRFSRHVLLPEIGEGGQARLEAERVHLEGEPGSVAVAGLYLERAGLTLDPSGVVHAVSPIDPGRPELRVASEFVAGALAAVEVIKASVGAGEPSTSHVSLTGPGAES